MPGQRRNRVVQLTATALLAAALAAAPAGALPPAPSGLVQLPDPDECVANDAAGELGDLACKPAQGLTRPTGGVVSPDGRNVYVAAAALVQPGNVETGMIAAFARSTDPGPSLGALTQLPAPDNCLSRDPDGAGGNPPDNPSCGSIPTAAVGQIFGVAISPDGEHVYATSRGGNAVLVFDRSTVQGPSFGALTYSSCISKGGIGCGGMASSLEGARAIAVTPDGKNVYVAGDGGGSNVTALARNEATGALTALNCIRESTLPSAGCTVPGGRALVGPVDLAVSPDGQNVYLASSSTSDGVAVLRRDLAQNAPFGEIAEQVAGPAGCVTQTGFDHVGGTMGACTDGRGLDGAVGVAVSPGGEHVYAAALDSDAVAVLSRDAGADGALSQAASTAACRSDDPDGPGGNQPQDPGCDGAFPLGGAGDVAVSPDGASVYALAGTAGQSAVTAFDRDDAQGTLSPLAGPEGCLADDSVTTPCVKGPGLAAPQRLWLPPDGRNVYLSSFLGRAVAELRRVEAGQPGSGDGQGAGSGAGSGADAGTPPAGPLGESPAAAGELLRGLSLSRRRFAIGRRPTSRVAARRRTARGTAFRYSLRERATVTIAIERAVRGRRAGRRCVRAVPGRRRGRPCTRYVRVARPLIRRNQAAGHVTTAFSGRIGRRALRPGRYRARVVAVDAAGNRSRELTARFTIVRRLGRNGAGAGKGSPARP